MAHLRSDLRRIVLASSNRGKLAEIRELLADSGVELIAQSELGIDDAEESGATFVENALIKARHAARVSGLPALGDDSGICVDALGGAPGLHSARYAGGHGDAAANIAKLLSVLKGFDDARRGAHFHCTIVLLRTVDDPAPLIAEGRWSGRILRHHAASRVSATTRSSSIRFWAKAPASSTRLSRIASAIAGRRCRVFASGWRFSDGAQSRSCAHDRARLESTPCP